MARSLYVLTLATALAFAGPAAFADDEKPAPKKVRIKIKTSDGDVATSEQTPDATASTQRSPMPVIERWLRGKLGGAMTKGDADPLGGMLKQWFDGGADVPMADLRDALKADGWDADAMQAWMLRSMADATATMHAMPFFSSRTFGPYVSGPRTFTWRGQSPFGQSPFGQGPMGHGPMGHGWQGHHGHHGWGMGPGHGWRHGWQGWMPRGRMHGFHGGPRWRMRRGPGPMHGWQGGQHGGMHGAQPRVHRQQRAFILWNDGTGWQRRELPGPHAQPPVPPRPPVAPRAPQPPATPKAGTFDIQGLEQLKKMLEEMKTRGFDPSKGDLETDSKQLKELLEMLKKLGG